MPAAPAARPRSSRPTSIIRCSRSAKASQSRPPLLAGIREGDPRQVRLQPVLSARRQRDAHARGAADKAKSLDPVKVALALEGMEFEVFDGGKGYMRKDDHQFFQPMYIASFGERTEKEPFDEEKTGWGWKLVGQDRYSRRPCFRPPARWNGRTDRSRASRPPRKTFGTDASLTIRLRRCVVLELIVISTLNGVLFGMLLFLMASGLTVIFSMLGVLNFAHASFYMLGAFFGFQISRWFGFWPALLIAPLLAGAIGAGVERFGLRRVHKNGHVAELLFTFGLAFVIEEIVQIIWGKSPVDFRIPPVLDFPAFTIFSTNYPAYKMFMLLVSIAIFAGLLIVLKKTRIGLIVQAALTHPHMVGHLGHNVGRIFMLVFGVGTALAAVAGVIAGPALVTQANMAGLLGPILFVVVVVGGLGSLPGAFVASLLIGLVQTFAVSMNGSLSGAFGPLSPAYAATWLPTSGASPSRRSRRSCPMCCWC
jgi:branched-chain amino acid transport system permease protein